MEKFYQKVVKYKIPILVLFLVASVVCIALRPLISVNYSMNDYLPADSASTVSLQLLEQQFEGGIPNARVMVQGISLAEALQYKQQLQAIDGVTEVTWLDDAVDITVPLAMRNEKTVQAYYRGSTALFSLTLGEEKAIAAVDEIRALIGDENAISGSAVATAIATTSTESEIAQIAAIAVVFVLIVLALTTNSWAQPLLVMVGLGVAIAINAGTNLMFGEISFVTNAAGNILQLAVSLDYAVFLLHRFEECKEKTADANAAMVQALCKSTSSILSSGLTTVIGFLALIIMRFGIGKDLGLALAKGVAISLLTVFVFMPGLILSCQKWLEQLRHRPFMPSFHKAGRLVQRLMVPLTIVFVVVIAPAFLASNANEYYYGSSNIFGEDTQLGSDTKRIEAAFGESDTYVLLVPKGDFATETQLSAQLQALPQVTGVISYVDMAGATIPTAFVNDDARSLLIGEDYSRMVLSVQVPTEGEEAFALVQQIRTVAQGHYPDAYYLAGEGVSTYDLMQTITSDMQKVNLVAIAAVFFVLLLTLKSITLPVILVLSIETAIWLNLSLPYFMGNVVFYIAYLIISSIQLGATVDYAILFTDRYIEFRHTMGRRSAIVQTIESVSVSILTSGSCLTVIGLLLGKISTHGLLSQLGMLLGQGTLCSLAIVFFVLPGLLFLCDGIIQKTSLHLNFYKKSKEKL